MTQNKPQKQPKIFLRQGNELFLKGYVSLPSSAQLSCFSLPEDKTEDKKTHQQAAGLGLDN